MQNDYFDSEWLPDFLDFLGVVFLVKTLSKMGCEVNRFL